MQQRIIISIQLILGLMFFQNAGFSEGSKEIYIGTHNTWLFMCTDNVLHCNNGGDRTPFATYNCTDNDRLYFATLSTHETVFLGFNANVDGGGAGQNHVVFEIRDASGTIVYSEVNVPTSGTGYISNIGQARTGPLQIYGAGGYTAIDFHPAVPGIFYIEFAARNNASGNFYSGGIDMNLIDVTIQDTVASVVKPGRLWSKSWQFYENGQNCSATTYIYSIDSIITSCAFNTMKGGIWVQFCNQWGCQNTNNFPVDRKSKNSQSLLPEFKIFLNNPDSLLFPPATTLGQIVPPQPYGIQNCNTGHIDYYVNVNKPGSVEIDLSFPPPYVTRVLNQVVVVGTNTITWDGLDGTVPVGVPVPNGVLVTFTVKYINGLTNLPFYDIEGNPNGFVVALVNPPGAEPLLYWDDSNVGGGTNLTGCSSPPPPGCHTWNDPWGNVKTINTWWFNVSSTTAPLPIIQFRHAGTLVFNQPPPSLCAGTMGQFFSVSTEANTEQYHWNYTGTGATIHQVNPTDNFVTVDFAVNATSGNLTVNGTNSNCLAPGPTSSLAVTIKPVPVINPPFSNSICTGVTTNILLTSTPASVDFSWISPPPSCSANVVACPPGQINSNVIADAISLSDANPGTVIYHIISTLNGCTSTPQDDTLHVLASPLPAITGNNNVCVGATGVIYSTANGMSNYQWTISPDGNITFGGGTNSVTVTWNTIGSEWISVGYTDPSLCTSLNPGILPVTVNGLPHPLVSGPLTPCKASAGNVYSTLSGMSNYAWIVSAGGLVTSGGMGTDNSVTVTWNNAGAQTVSVNYHDLNGCTALSPFVYDVTVNDLPVPVVTGPTGICLNTSGTYQTAPGMTSYQWTVSPGGNITFGGGTNSVQIFWSTIGVKTITCSYTDANGCTAASPTDYSVTVVNLPSPFITGPASVCSASSATYTTQAGMLSYSWLVSAGGTISGGGTTSDNTITVDWITAGAQTVSVNYTAGTGCTGADFYPYGVNVKPRPAVTNAANSTICSGVMTNIPIQASLLLTTFTWTATGSSGNVTGYSASGGSPISQVLVNSGFNVETVDYAVTPSLNGCDGAVAHFIVTVNPVADVYFNPNGQTICSGGLTNIAILSHVATTTFTWTASGSSGSMGGFSNGVTSTIGQTLTNSGTDPGTVTYNVSSTFNSCPGYPGSVTITVNPLPVVTLTACMDAVTTTDAKSFTLKGGLPLGGTYSGGGVNTGVFYPSLAGPGSHTITYTYANTWLCTALATKIITVSNPAVFNCDDVMMDIRDNKHYATVKLGTQCWMAANLNYGTYIPNTQMQRDNCTAEKFCYTNNAANCTPYGGLYQWDELMQYDNTAAAQGFCPPAWHVPTENEWNTLFTFYISTGFAAAPLKYSGYSGFNALVSGMYHNNLSWDFNGFASMIWSSTSHGPDKAWAHGMNDPDPSVSSYPSNRTHAFNIRCIKD